MGPTATLGGEDRAHIQFITPSSMVDAGPRWADQMNSSNEAAKATPQTTTTVGFRIPVGRRQLKAEPFEILPAELVKGQLLI